MTQLKQIGLIGCGWLGARVVAHLLPARKVVATTTSEDRLPTLGAAGIEAHLVKFSDTVPYLGPPAGWVSGCDVLLITVPFSKRTAPDDLLHKLRNLIAYTGPFDGQVFFMSSIGVYGATDGLLTEDNVPPEELHVGLEAVENGVRVAYPQANILRLGGLMGDERYLSKYAVREPLEWANHVHYYDVGLVVAEMIRRQTSGKLYNLVAPRHRNKQEILDYQLEGILPVGIATGRGRRISSEKLQRELNYTFALPDPLYFKDR